VKDALIIRNDSNVTLTLQLLSNDDVIVWRENGGWTDPFKILLIGDIIAIVNISYEPTNFRITVVKSYHRDKTTDISVASLTVTNPSDVKNRNNDSDYNFTADVIVKRDRERPKDSKNKPKITLAATNRLTTKTFLSAKKE